MTNIKCKPSRHHFENDLNRIFGHIFNAPLHQVIDDKKTVTSPVYANVAETNSNFTISLAIPGYEKSDIEISLDKNKLTIKGKKQASNETKYSVKEFDFSGFERSFFLPEDVQADKIEAKTENGILYVYIPKEEIKPAINITVQ